MGFVFLLVLPNPLFSFLRGKRKLYLDKAVVTANRKEKKGETRQGENITQEKKKGGKKGEKADISSH